SGDSTASSSSTSSFSTGKANVYSGPKTIEAYSAITRDTIDVEEPAFAVLRENHCIVRQRIVSSFTE
ncbi:unnamed protein product, partial [Amoebophrya sp. A25]